MSTILVRPGAGHFEEARTYIEDVLNGSRVSKEIIFETMFIFEALFNSISDQGFDPDTELRISVSKGLGGVSIKLGFPGEMFVPLGSAKDDESPEYRIVKAYEDRLEYRYSSSYNVIRLTVKRGVSRSLLFCGIGFLLALVVYALFGQSVGEAAAEILTEKYFDPIERLFTNAVMMTGTMVFFFSLMKNMTDIYILSERQSSVRKLQLRAVVTSVIAICLAVAFGLAATNILSGPLGLAPPISGFAARQTFGEFVSSLIPSSLPELFAVTEPYPVLIIALIATYALCSVGKHFDFLKQAIDSCYTFFCRVLNVLMYALPVFCYIAFLDALLVEGGYIFAVILIILAVSLIGLLIGGLLYLVSLKAAGIAVGPFLAKLPGLIRENLMIGSAIDAVPFNIRYSVRNYGISRKHLEEVLPVLAQINLDGNCFLLMLFLLLFAFFAGIAISWVDVIMIGVLVLFLSFGAPNQPGSIVIGSMIVSGYLNTPEILTMAIYLEVLLGSVQNIANVVGDIVTARISEK